MSTILAVDQTFFVDDESGVPGNCLQAAIATVFATRLENVPHFVLFEDQWREALYLWLDAIGYELSVYHEDQGELGIAVGMSPRGVRHAVVWHNGMVHDPHPSRAGFVGDPDEYWVFRKKETGETDE